MLIGKMPTEFRWVHVDGGRYGVELKPTNAVSSKQRIRGAHNAFAPARVRFGACLNSHGYGQPSATRRHAARCGSGATAFIRPPCISPSNEAYYRKYISRIILRI